MVKVHFLGRVQLHVVCFDEHFVTNWSPSVVIAAQVPPLVLVVSLIFLVVTHLDLLFRLELLDYKAVTLGRAE